MSDKSNGGLSSIISFTGHESLTGISIGFGIMTIAVHYGMTWLTPAVGFLLFGGLAIVFAVRARAFWHALAVAGGLLLVHLLAVPFLPQPVANWVTWMVDEVSEAERSGGLVDPSARSAPTEGVTE